MDSRIFIHGLESSNQGTKAVFFRRKYPDMMTPHFTGPLDERMKRMEAVLSSQTAITIVGSSFGGLMASIFALENEDRVKRLILLAPAIHWIEFTSHRIRKTAVPVWIYHGRQDEVIDIKEVQRAAAGLFADLKFHTVEDDHFLHKTFKTIPWDRLLS
ncbi:MAG: alpha/beta fold hydrolase [Deltaproteobacteria bacterium]|nr:alpha/beta fold hydrolase [Deltaproteobacteria bacterium]